jgi:hypothetical protein
MLGKLVSIVFSFGITLSFVLPILKLRLRLLTGEFQIGDMLLAFSDGHIIKNQAVTAFGVLHVNMLGFSVADLE